MKHVSLTLVMACTVIAFSAQAQLKFPSVKNAIIPTATNTIRTDIQKIIADFPNQFVRFKGDIVNQSPQRVEYLSTLLPNSAQSATITEYSYNKKPVYSWQALMLTTEDFEAAAKKYKALYTQVKGAYVTFNANQSYYLQGNYEAPDESKDFLSSMLNFYTRDEDIKRIKVEVNMQFEFPEWKVNLLVYSRERDDDERGNIFDN